MQLEHIRKMARQSAGLNRQSKGASMQPMEWKQDSVNITHMPLSMVHHRPRNGPDQPSTYSGRTYFPTYKVQSVLGKKLVIKREMDDDSKQNLNSNEKPEIFARLQHDDDRFTLASNHPYYKDDIKQQTEEQEEEDNDQLGQWASKRLKLCAADITDINNVPDNQKSVLNLSLNTNGKNSQKFSKLDNMINILHSGQNDNTALQRGTSFLHEKDEVTDFESNHRVIDLTMSGDKARNSDNSSPIMFSNQDRASSSSQNPYTGKYFDMHDSSNKTNNTDYSRANGNGLIHHYPQNNKQDSDSLLNWEFLKVVLVLFYNTLQYINFTLFLFRCTARINLAGLKAPKRLINVSMD